MNKVIYRTTQNAIDAGIDIWDDTKIRLKRLGEWVIDNPQATVSIVSTIAMLLRVGQSLIVSKRVYSQQRRSDYTYYDRSSGHHWTLRRKLTNRDRAVIDRRKHNGDDMFDILSDLGVI